MTDTLAAPFDQQRLELLRHRLAQRGLLAAPAPAADSAAMTDGQRRMWFVQSIDTTGALLNVSVSYRLRGELDPARLRAAVDAVADRHPILRTTYHVDAEGEPRPVVRDDLKPGWAQHDLRDLGAQARGLRLDVLAQRTFTTPFDLSADAPLRVTLATVGQAEHVLLLAAHHIAWDDASWRVFFADLTRAYSGGALEPAAPHAIPLSDNDLADVQYWRSVLVDPPEPLELPGARGSVVPSDWRAGRCTVRLDADTTAAITRLAQESGATPYMVLLAAFSALLHRYTHAEDFLVAAPVLNRESEAVIGYYGNTVALRMRPRRWGTVAELVNQARDTAVGAFAHQRVNLDRVVAELNPDRRYGVERMARVGFGMREPYGAGFSPPDLHCRRAEFRGRFAQLPLGFMVEHIGGEIEVEAEYLTEVIDADLARQLLDSFVVLLGDAVAHPDKTLGDLALLNDDDTAWLQQNSHGEHFDCPAMTLPELIAETAARQPDEIAVVYEGRRYSYREINEAANRHAHWLIGQGIGAEDRVAVLLDKSPELVITALGIAKAGAVYLPVDPEYPADRIAYILADSDPKMVVREPITETEHLPATDPAPSDLVRPFGPANTAYVIYTSGSTGLPKGVSVPHQPVADYFRWFAREYHIGPDDRLLQVASPSFDVSIGEIFGVLAQGARLVIPRSDGLRDIGYLTDLLTREAITSMHFVPSLLGLFLSLPGVEQWRTLRRVPIGGEALPGELADKFHATFDALLHNFYGPTETVINASRYRVQGRQGPGMVPIGTPKINTSIHLLDDALRPVPVDVIGEIYIGGTQLAHGYHHRPALTAERFVADPFNPGGRLYRSGDLARRNRNGDLEFVGRADEQVKIRGFRIELGEVAAAITVDPSVGNAVVIAADLPHLGKSLVAYAAPGAEGAVDVDRIKARVAAALPDYMVPAAYVVVGEIPVTANGKLDRAALPEPEIAPASQYRAPGTETERAVAALFTQLLGATEVGCDDSFFGLGGHSLLATKLVAAIRGACGVEVSVREAFERGTVGELAALIDDRRAAPVASPRPPLVSCGDTERSELSAAQLRSWFQYRVDGPSPVNNIPFAARLTGPCDVDALVLAARDTVARHEILRTVYREVDGVPRQVVVTNATDVRCLEGPDSDWLTTQLDAERGHCFDLETQLPIRIAVLSTPHESVLSVVVHHIAADHWSAGVLFTDVLTAYRAHRDGTAPDWAPLPVQYSDYAAWQRQLLADTEMMDTQRDYWVRQLDGLPEDTGLRPDLPRPPVAGGAGASVPLQFDARVRERLTALCRELGITEFMLLQTAVAIVLSKAGGGYDIPLGTPVAGRTDAQLDRLIGFFVNVLVLRNDLSGNPTLREALLRSRETALGAYAHQDLPFDRVVDAVSPVRSLSRNPLFGVVVHVREELPEDQVIETGRDGETRFTALEPTFDVAHADLSVNFFAGDDGYRGHLIYRTELYRPSTMHRFADWLNQIIEALATDPDIPLRDVTLIAAAEREQVLEQSRGPASPADRPRTVPELLDASRTYGERTALRCGDDQLDYAALHDRSDRFAQLLKRHGVGPGSLVGMSMRRGIDLVVALVGIMKAGAGFFPVDPGYPAARKQLLLDDVTPSVVVVSAQAGAAMPAADGVTIISMDDPAIRAELDAADAGPLHTAVRPAPPHPDDPMYLMFTSGSTGKPKGVVGTHRAMSTRLTWQLKHYPVTGNDIRLAQAPMTFLEGCIETLAGLAAGATLIVADDAEHRDAEALAGLIERHSVAQVTAVASLASALVDNTPDAVRGLRRLVCCGEPVNAALLGRLAACVDGSPTVETLNAIGATETSGALVRGPLDLPTPKLGRPMEGSQVYLLDDALAPVPVGVVGELYYAGEQLARGYWKQPGLTATRFIPNPYAGEPGSRFYRSGDRGRWTDDGRLEFVGRTDHQVKVRGFRVELAEVEAALKAADGVAVAAARTWDGPSGATLAGYVVAHRPIDDPAAFAAAVRASVAATLPGYMTPSTISVLDEMPATESGKLNRPGLPRPEVHTTGCSEPVRTDTERSVAAAMGQLLHVAGVGRDDDFFALGGDSILSVQLAARMRAAGLAVDPRMIFEHPTVASLAGAIDRRPDCGASADTRHRPMSVSGLSAGDLAALTSSWGKAQAVVQPGAQP